MQLKHGLFGKSLGDSDRSWGGVWETSGSWEELGRVLVGPGSNEADRPGGSAKEASHASGRSLAGVWEALGGVWEALGGSWRVQVLTKLIDRVGPLKKFLARL